MRIIIRADGGSAPEIGTGHINRTLLLAEAIQEHSSFSGCNITFATRSDEVFKFGKKQIEGAGYDILDMNDFEHDSHHELEKLLFWKPDLVIFDRLATSTDTVRGLKEKGIKVITFDDEGSGGPHADLVINALLQNVLPNENTLIGHQYLILPKLAYKVKRPNKKVNNIFVCFGGHDHQNFSYKFIHLLAQEPIKAHFDLIVGNMSGIALEELQIKIENLNGSSYSDITIHSQPNYFHKLLHMTDLAIVSGGITAFEAVQNGIPSIGVPQYEHQERNLDRLEKLGVIQVDKNAFSGKNLSIVKKVKDLIHNFDQRVAMWMMATEVFDGKGTQRVCNAISKIII